MNADRRVKLTAESAESAEILVRGHTASSLNHVSDRVIGAGIRVHRALGPGLLESAYEACLAFELAELGMDVVRQQPMPVVYRGVRLDCGYRTDLIVEDEVIVEVKAVARLEPIHEAQLISYLKLSDRRLGLLMNFNVRALKHGVRRLVHGFPKAA